MGIDVQCPHLGFTESHTLAVNVAKNGEVQCALDLERANIIVNKNMLPGDTSAVSYPAWRLGTQELTRLGMEKGDGRCRAPHLPCCGEEGEPGVREEGCLGAKKDFNKCSIA